METSWGSFLGIWRNKTSNNGGIMGDLAIIMYNGDMGGSDYRRDMAASAYIMEI
jgi:hypothetical protein